MKEFVPLKHHEHCGCGCGHSHDEANMSHHHEHHDHDDCCEEESHHHHHDHDGCCEEEHHHHDHDECCGEEHHHHDHDCGCGEEHHHEHPHLKTVHGPNCTCELCHPHAEYCDVCGQSLIYCTCSMPDDGVEKAVYLLENLGCANCAAKMERKIKDLPGVIYATITYATKQLRLSADHQDELLPKIQEICSSIESDVRVVPRQKSVGHTKTVIWNVEGLDRVNDGEELEKKVNELPPVISAVFLPGTEQLKVTAASPERLFPALEKICREIDPSLQLKKAVVKKATEEKVPFLKREGNKALVSLGIGAVLFGAAILLSGQAVVSLALFIVSYLVLAKDILLTAGKNIIKGQVFDENFLMAVASLGAFAVGDYKEAVAVVMFFCVGEIFEDRAVAKSRSQIMDAIDMRPETVHLMIGEKTTDIPAEDAVVGDIVMVRPGDRIPLDGIVLEGESRIDTSPVTGEPVPVAVGFGDEVVSGCVNTSGVLRIRVEKVLGESMVTRILDSVEQAAASKPRIDRFITRFARVYTPCVVALAVATAVIPSLITGNWSHWIYTALTFLVISCPCALVLSVPLAYFSGIGFGSRHGILFKGGAALEALKDVRAVVMDKTGTVTQGCFTVAEICSEGNWQADEILSMAASAEMASTHPIGNSIIAAAKERNLDFERLTDSKEIAGKGVAGKYHEKELLCGSRSLMAEHGVDFTVTAKNYQGTVVYVAWDNKAVGLIVISDIIKADAAKAIAEMSSLGLITAMLTGDHEATAAAVAAETGIDEYQAGLMPQDKLTALGKIRDHHGAVMFVGDGINDAPVLAGADVGAAMGSGADAAIEAADVVFMNSEMSAVPLAIKTARKVGKIALENVVFALVVKFSVMILGLLGFANMWYAIFADTGVAVLCILNSIRILYGSIR